MRQSKKETRIRKAAGQLLHADRREAFALADTEDDMEAAAEWASPGPAHRREQPDHS
ncbi:hypothetical protein ABEV74_03360 [Paenibacillus cisolokensis]|uniref:Uncharacterized protein n=1 Tax=Paenibacillus cisolokensis TaxID=1658519 RepID=A0ABQ4N802_9BACL|nr:hypothetical protein [Paenibacillus cisolokensis]GIQ64068.1 hypothetical protein PACILC2_26360 [Paenibacillus cisolokensis]